MSEYPIQFKDGTWGWKHALDEPDFSAEWEEHDWTLWGKIVSVFLEIKRIPL